MKNMLYGIDFSFGSGLTTAQIKAGKKQFVCRYLSGGAPKDISAAELANYKDAGIPVVFVWETTGTDMTSQASGVADATGADSELKRIGAPGATVFFAADEQTEPAEGPYLQGAASVIGQSRTGIYGGLGSVQNGFASGHVAYGWQTYAWSNNTWDNRALLRQVQNNVQFGPATVDLDEAAYWSSSRVLGLGDDFGQWPRPSHTPPPPPPQGPYKHTVAAGNKESLWRVASNRHVNEQSLIDLSLANLGPLNKTVFSDYVALENACRADSIPLPAMPEGMAYYTKNP